MSGLHHETIREGNGVDKPKKGDTVIIEYTGNLYDPEAQDGFHRGKQFDSSVGRGDFKTEIGVGRVIKGWDEGVMQMTLGQKSVLTIPSHLAYGDRGFPGLIPPGSTLVFEVELKGINNKHV